MRAALEWCFSQRGDQQIGRDLVLTVVPWFLRLSLLAELAECHSLSERTIALLPDADKGTERELALLESQALSAMFTLGKHGSVRAALQRGLDLASALRAGPLDILAMDQHLSLRRNSARRWHRGLAATGTCSSPRVGCMQAFS